jgi:hypothetical protein
MRYVPLLAVAVMLAGCGSTSEVVRAGPDTYMISSGGGIYEQNPSSIRQEVYEQANDYCDEKDKTMTPVDTNERQYELGKHTASISLTFKCEDRK